MNGAVFTEELRDSSSLQFKSLAFDTEHLVVFEAQKKVGMKNDIALDDISLTRGPCLWTVHARKGWNIQLHMLDFDVEATYATVEVMGRGHSLNCLVSSLVGMPPFQM
ncbi:hypothetical protein J4Q44_G00243570 [Coregonus suidteri]|uniref:Uncharacterized protein n=1 Tax=Coregonus suidteri TaxID=861788 RepID=A0AAN8LCB9_9TELE